MDKKRVRILGDVNVYRGAAGGMSDHYLVEAIIRMKGFQKREREEVTLKRVVTVRGLRRKK